MRQSAVMERALEEFERLPGIGPKSAQRIVYWLLNNDESFAYRLAEAISDVRRTVHFCPVCFNYAEEEQCAVCADEGRDERQICVVEQPRDISNIDRTGQFEGRYHVLGGVISPIDGIGPGDLHIAELMQRLSSNVVEEVLVATNPTVEGEATASYLSRMIKPLGIKVTRLASGLPVGCDLEFADEVTLGRAIEARREL